MVSNQIDSKWISWIQENLKRGSTVPVIAQIIADNFSFSIAKATAIVEKVRQAPINVNVEKKTVSDEKERREWMMMTLDKMQRLSRSAYNIDSSPALPFEQFVDEYYALNRPVILKGAFDHWPAKKWTPDSLLNVAKDKEVEVQFDREKNPSFEMDSIKHKKKMSFQDYFDLVMNTESSNNFYMTANNARSNQSVFKSLFADMLNFADGYFDQELHTTRSFIWFGPKGNYTPLHHDQTNNMFLQIYGRKRFLLVPPNQTPYLYNKTAVFSPIDLRSIDDKRYPLAKNVTPIEITIAPGEALFIPVGWWHQVDSLDVSISITVTNFNAMNSFV